MNSSSANKSYLQGELMKAIFLALNLFASQFLFAGEYAACEVCYAFTDLKGNDLTEQVECKTKSVEFKKSSNHSISPSTLELTPEISFELSISDYKDDAHPEVEISISGQENDSDFVFDYKSNNGAEYFYAELENIFVDNKLLYFDVECTD